jgi:beta-D-xylosidase 4
MCSYNATNGVPACASQYFLEDILRQHWQWEADDHWITSDCDAVQDIYDSHHYVDTAAEAAAVALKAGTDLECVVSSWDGLTQAWNASLITEQNLDKALIRLYASLIDLGFFDAAKYQPLRTLGWDAVNSPSAQKLALDSAVEGLVLIKNDGVLPLGIDTAKSYALIGPYYEATQQLQGNYYGPAPYLISPLQAAQNLGLNIVSALGSKINDTDSSYADAITTAKSADTIIFLGGIDNTIESESLDRATIVWPEPQLDLLRQLTALGKPVIVVQFGGGQLDDSELLANSSVNAVLWAGYPGQSGGAAIFDVLTGKAAPAGRLPTTQYPASYATAVSPLDMNLRPAPGNGNLGRTHM